ncbi:hypothetical protein [Bacillus phage vB_BanS-Thrax2]|nr:hypothetical protein [Bacillus phage vB_BanS-Thrax2]
MGKFTDRRGEINFNKYGSKLVVVEYKNANDIVVEFENGYKVHTTYQNFKKGNVKSVYDKSVFNVGYIGEGNYKPSINSKDTHCYSLWVQMLRRCYDKKLQEKQPTYKDCKVVNEWHNFQNFAQWYNDNYYKIEGKQMQLDKDILIKGNKTYSPETCVFVPKNINVLFVKADTRRGKFPIGVSYCKHNQRYKSECHDGTGTKIFLGYSKTPTDAFEIYKSYKELVIKDVANDYLGKIPMKLYRAMIAYDVEIDD